jgi:tetratricopeptide (TPR) repeat protein
LSDCPQRGRYRMNREATLIKVLTGKPPHLKTGLKLRLAINLSLLFCLWLGPQCLANQQAPARPNERFREATEALRQGRLDDAATGFADVIKDAPTFAEAHFNLGLVLEEQGKNEEAIASLQMALKLKPRLRGANLFLGIAEYKINQFDQAIASLKKESALDPSNPNAWMWLGVVQLAAGHADEAAESLDRAAKLDPKNVDILYHRGQAHLLVSRDSYTRMFKEDPASWHVRQVLAQTAAAAERHEEAIAEYLEAIKLAPAQPGLHEELGTQYRIAGKLDDAEAAFRRELDLDPHNILATYKLGVLEVEQNRPRDGIKLIESAIKAKPDLMNADYNLGRAKMALNDDQGALDHLKRATTGNSDLETLQLAWYQLGIVYRRLNRNQAARQAMAEYQKLKDQEAAGLQQRMNRFTNQQNVQTGDEPVKPVDPNP